MNIYHNTHDVSVQESASDTPDDYDQLMLFNFRHESEKISEHPEETSKEYLAHQSKEKIET